MHPRLASFDLPLVGEVAFESYAVMLVLAFLVAITALRRDGERLGMRGDQLVDLGILMLVAGVMGARLMAVFTDGKFMDFVHLCTDPTQVPALDSNVAVCSAQVPCDFHYQCDVATGTCHPPRDCFAALKFWQGGLTYYGGFLLAVPLGLLYARRKNLGVWRVADLAAPVIMLGLVLGRIGCFLNGCCYGAPTDAPIGVQLPGHAGPVHPTQLYEAVGALALFLALRYAIAPRKRRDGDVFAALLVLYGVMRFAIELLRADQRGSLGPLSTSQALSIPLIAAGVWLLLRPAPAADDPDDKPSDPEGDAIVSTQQT
jgi:phosphatidylglycerol:prolipoprotein diacylglycerol transferase